MATHLNATLKTALEAQGIEALLEDEGMFETLMDAMNTRAASA